MISDPYERNLVNRNFYASKIDIETRVVAVLDGKLDNRNLNLIKPISRTFSKGTIIELILTDEDFATPGVAVNRIAYLAFVELLNGGVLLYGDELLWNDMIIGKIVGFDDTHMPNHQNTVIYSENRISGKELGIKVNDRIIIKGIKME